MSAVRVVDLDTTPIVVGPMRRRHLRSVLRIESCNSPRGWSLGLFMSELSYRDARVYLVAKHENRVIGFAGLLFATFLALQSVPRGFIPTLDQGYAIVVIQLPDGASLARTDDVIRRAAKIIMGTKGIAHAVPFTGLDGATLTNASNAGAIFTVGKAGRFTQHRQCLNRIGQADVDSSGMELFLQSQYARRQGRQRNRSRTAHSTAPARCQAQSQCVGDPPTLAASQAARRRAPRNGCRRPASGRGRRASRDVSWWTCA
jgi:multidrug efflux pump subunit AcrB